MTSALRPVQVVVAFDFSASAEEALSRAVDVAARARQHTLHIVVALDPHEPISGMSAYEKVTYDTADRIQLAAKDAVSALLVDRRITEDIQFHVHARIGTAADEILAVAEEVGADLIFIGSHNKAGLERLLLGSVSERVVRQAGCPVMVVRPKTYGEVDLLKVFRYEHERLPHRAPHCYTYTSNRVLLRPKDWPLS